MQIKPMNGFYTPSNQNNLESYKETGDTHGVGKFQDPALLQRNIHCPIAVVQFGFSADLR